MEISLMPTFDKQTLAGTVIVLYVMILSYLARHTTIDKSDRRRKRRRNRRKR